MSVPTRVPDRCGAGMFDGRQHHIAEFGLILRSHDGDVRITAKVRDIEQTVMCRAVGADYAGVDIIQGRDGRFLVLEVNSMPAWNGLQQVTRINISDFVVDAFLAASLRPGWLKGREVL